jgi:hypothetical protein
LIFHFGLAIRFFTIPEALKGWDYRRKEGATTILTSSPHHPIVLDTFTTIRPPFVVDPGAVIVHAGDSPATHEAQVHLSRRDGRSFRIDSVSSELPEDSVRYDPEERAIHVIKVSPMAAPQRSESQPDDAPLPASFTLLVRVVSEENAIDATIAIPGVRVVGGADSPPMAKQVEPLAASRPDPPPDERRRPQ